jgi:hypothetical protein
VERGGRPVLLDRPFLAEAQPGKSFVEERPEVIFLVVAASDVSIINCLLKLKSALQ